MMDLFFICFFGVLLILAILLCQRKLTNKVKLTKLDYFNLCWNGTFFTMYMMKIWFV